MKKIYFFALILISGAAFGQTITPIHPNLAYSGPDNLSHSIDVEIQNSGSTTLTILVHRIGQSLSSGHDTYFCWFECYDPSVALSPVPLTLAPGESTANFHSYVTPTGVAGQDTVTYAFYDQNGNSDTLYLTLTYDFIHDGINELSGNKSLLNIFVNESKTATIKYAAAGGSQSKIQVSNILGKVVKEISLSENASSIKVPLYEMNQGIYFCNLISDDKLIASKRFIISR